MFLDNAYADFSDEESWLSKLSLYPNLIVSQTLSKAWGKAAIRIGMAYGSREIIAYFNKVKPPYNVSQLNQQEAIRALEEYEIYESNRQHILQQRSWLETQLAGLSLVEKIYPSDANFILLKTKNANGIYQKLVEDQIVVRNRHSLVENCLRISVGTAAENQKLMETLRKLQEESESRKM